MGRTYQHPRGASMKSDGLGALWAIPLICLPAAALFIYFTMGFG